MTQAVVLALVTDSSLEYTIELKDTKNQGSDPTDGYLYKSRDRIK